MINTRNIGFREVRREKLEYLSEETVSRLSSHLLKPGDIVFGRKGSVERHVLITEECNRWFQGADCLRLRMMSLSIDNSFLSYSFLIEDHQLWMMNQSSHGATMTSLNQDIIRRIPLWLPPLQVQKRIAGILSAYDELIENSQRRIRILEEMARAFYREWFVLFRFPGHENFPLVASSLGEIPKGWEVKKLADLISYNRRATKPGLHLVDRRYVPIDCIPSKSLVLLDAKPIEEAQSSLQLFEKGDILFGAMRPYFHKVVVAPFTGVTRTTCFVFKPAHPQWHSFATLTAFDEGTVAYATAHSQGATIPYAVWDGSLAEMPLSLPPDALLRMFDNVVAPILAKLSQSFFKLSNLRRTRDLLLPRLLSGEVNLKKN